MSGRVSPARISPYHLGHQGTPCDDTELHDRSTRNLAIALRNGLFDAFTVHDDPEGLSVSASMRCGCVFLAFGFAA